MVAAGSEGACVSIASINGAACAGNVAANRVVNGISPSPMATKCRALGVILECNGGEGADAPSAAAAAGPSDRIGESGSALIRGAGKP